MLLSGAQVESPKCEYDLYLLLFATCSGGV